FFNDTATTEIYTLSLHDALPISCASSAGRRQVVHAADVAERGLRATAAACRAGRVLAVVSSQAARPAAAVRRPRTASPVADRAGRGVRACGACACGGASGCGRWPCGAGGIAGIQRIAC